MVAEKRLQAIDNRPTPLALAEPDERAWELMLKKAATLVKSGLLPREINTPEKAAAVMLKGHEIKVPAMYALSNIYIINGKPSCSSELMLALIYRDHGDSALRVKETTATKCVIEYRRRSWEAPETFEFTEEDRKLAGLGSDTWKKFPKAMLRSRCISAIARMSFADSIGGMYTPEELGAAVHVDGEVVVYDGEIVDTTARIGSEPNPAISAESVAEVIDVETGEIIEQEPRTKSDHERAMSALHATAAERFAWTHDELHIVAVAKYKVESLKDLTADQLAKFTNRLKQLSIDESAKLLSESRKELTPPTEQPEIIEAEPAQPSRSARFRE